MSPFLVQSLLTILGPTRPRSGQLRTSAVNLLTPWHFINWRSRRGVLFLANAQIDCPEGKVLANVQMERQLNTFRYVYECFGADDDLEYETVANEWTAYMGLYEKIGRSSGVNFLDRQNVDCSGKGFLTSIQMEVHLEAEMLRYVYRCGRKTNALQSQVCRERQTAKQDADDFYLPSLMQHQLRCKDNEGLMKFRLRASYEPPNGYLLYHFSCCRTKTGNALAYFSYMTCL